MKFHGIDMVGALLLKDSVTGDSNTERAIGYDTDSVYFNDGSSWTKLITSGDLAIPAGTAMWFYANSPPVGWTIVTTIAADTVIGVKSSGGTYTTGGTVQGSWSTTYNHNHSVPSLSTPNHIHSWYQYSGGLSYTFDIAGSFQQITGAGTFSTNGLMSQVTSANSWIYPLNGYTNDSGASSTGTGTSGTTALSTARPSANVGVLATKDA